MHYYLLKYTVAQLVEALRYKPVNRGFGSRWSHWVFSLTYSFRLHYGSEVDSASDRNLYRGCFLVGKGGRCVWLTTLPLSCAGCLEILAASTSWIPGWRNRHSNTRVRTLKAVDIFRTGPDRPQGPPSLLYNTYRVSFPEVKMKGRGVDHLEL